jgi:hypothetical protein
MLIGQRLLHPVKLSARRRHALDGHEFVSFGLHRKHAVRHSRVLGSHFEPRQGTL